MYNKQAYIKYRDKIRKDPIKYEEWKINQREHGKAYLLIPINQENNRKRSKTFYNKMKTDKVWLKEERARQRLRNKNNRLLCLRIYSKGNMKCSCCSESELLFLEIEHIKGGGNKHRKAIGRDRIEEWLIRNNFPKGFGVLCCNCNKGKHLNGGICPHKSKRK